MEVKTVEHNSHKIDITYGYNNNVWTTEDEELEKALVKMYDHEDDLDKLVKDMFTEFYAANKRINTCRDNLADLQGKLDDVISIADGYQEKLGFPRPESFDDFAGQVNDVAAIMAEFDPPFRKLDRAMDKLLKKLNKWVEIYNNDYQKWDEFNEVKYRHFDNCETNSIDIVKFRQTEEMLRAASSVHGDKRRTSMDTCNDIYADYKCLVSEITTQYERWKEFTKRVVILQYVFKEKGVLPGVFAN